MTSPHIVATLTSFNRREQTLSALQCLAVAAAQAGVRLSAVLVDDGSSDGTAQAVARRFSWVQVLHGDGGLYWTRGMHLAMKSALNMVNADYVLWLNDDCHLYPDALVRLLQASHTLQSSRQRPGIVVGATADPVTGKLSYSGMVVAGALRPLAFRQIHSPTDLLPCDAMNGNVVLIPTSVAHSVGNLDPEFAHAMGDIDYGLRARRLGHPIAIAPGFIGSCRSNPQAGSFQDSRLGLSRRWQLFTDRKVLPPKSWLHLTRRHGGLFWPLQFALPYAVFFVKALWSALPDRKSTRLNSSHSRRSRMPSSA